MTSYWEPGTEYGNGQVVEYEGHRYKIIQPHRSQSDWTPPITPALWGRLQDHDNDQNQQYYNQPPTYQPPQSHSQQGGQLPNDPKVESSTEEHKSHWYDLDEKQKKQLEIGGGLAAGAALLAGGYALYKGHEKSEEQHQQQSQQHLQQHPQQHQLSEQSTHWYDDKRKLGLAAGAAVVGGGYALHKGHEKSEEEKQQHTKHEIESTKDEQRAHWYDLDDHRKKQLEIAGGIAAGTALLAGGYALYKGHEKSEEQKKAQARGLSDWVNDAKAKTDHFYKNGPIGAVAWVLTNGKNIPQGAIEGGQENSRTLYVCRAYLENSIQVGKASPAFLKGACIGYNHEEIEIDTYEILLGNMDALRWVPTHGRLNVSSLGYKPVEGGHEDDGTHLYIAQATYMGGVHPGKASEKLDGAYIPYGGIEQNVKEYRVLCYN